MPCHSLVPKALQTLLLLVCAGVCWCVVVLLLVVWSGNTWAQGWSGCQAVLVACCCCCCGL